MKDLTRLVLAKNIPDSELETTLKSFGFQDYRWADEILQELAGKPPLRQEFSKILPQLLSALGRSADPAMGLLNFARFAEGSISKAAFFSTLILDPDLIEVAIILFSTSQYFSDILIQDIRYFDWLRNAYSSGSLDDRKRMISELQAEVNALHSHEKRLSALRRFKRREILRIGFSDIVRGSLLENITLDLSNLADAILDVAHDCCLSMLNEKLGIPIEPNGRIAELAILAMGKLGGSELNYSSDIDLIFVYSADGKVNPSDSSARKSLTNQEFFNRLAEEIIRAISQQTDTGFVFRVDTRLRPDGVNGPLTQSISRCATYYQSTARMWEFQALLKARYAAGSEKVGKKFLANIEPLVYRKYLSLEQIQETKYLKGRMEREVARRGETKTGVKTGLGGIRDIEFIVQFHQLLLGGQYPEIRTESTLKALNKLGNIAALSFQEMASLESAYRFLRKTEHRLMTLHQLKLHSIPKDKNKLNRLSIRMGFQSHNGESPGDSFLKEYRRHTSAVRKIFEHTFSNLFETDSDKVHPEMDLILSPEISKIQIEKILKPFGFENAEKAYKRLTHLSEEDTPLLRSPRTHQYFASLAPSLLSLIADTPRPDSTLLHFDRVVSSLGAKTMLFQWMLKEEEALRLLLKICSVGQLLANILETRPGMFDGLVYSLDTNTQRDENELESELNKLLLGAAEPAAILNGFRYAELLRIGTRDLLQRSEILHTFKSLSHLAEAVLRCVVNLSFEKVTSRFGERPYDPSGAPIAYGVLAMGKFGGEELNYFSDLDVIFAYETNGRNSKGILAADYFTRLSQSISKMLTESSQYGRLFEMDARLRPAGSKGPLACSLEAMQHYYQGGQSLIWERQALTKARVVAGDKDFGKRLMKKIHHWIYRRGLSASEISDILQMRQKLENSVDEKSIKRGRGGIVDIEFLLQIFRLLHGKQYPALRTPNEMEAIESLENIGLIKPESCEQLRTYYLFLRRLENRLRMVTNRSTDELPGEREELNALARSLGYGKQEGQKLLDKCQQVRKDCRRLFERLINQIKPTE